MLLRCDSEIKTNTIVTFVECNLIKNVEIDYVDIQTDLSEFRNYDPTRNLSILNTSEVI